MKPFNKYFDHTLLKPDATAAQIRRVLEEAAVYDFASVCVNGCHVRDAADFLRDTDVKVACVVGFPLGAQTSDAKAGETRLAIGDGATEIDMVINIGAAKDGRWDAVRDEIRLLAEICHGGADANRPAQKSSHALLKVILETCLLTDEEVTLACRAACDAGADFVKTSTGFSTGGATVHHVQLMKQAILDWERDSGYGQTTSGSGQIDARPHMQIKASGGIRTLSDAQAMIEAGADRLGCSASVAIMEEYSR